MPPIGDTQILEEAVRAGHVRSAQRKAQQKGDQQNPPHIVPVEKLKPPALAKLLRVGPASPAEHAQDHRGERDQVHMRDKHGITS